MKGRALLDAMIEVAKNKGLAVRREALKGALSQGGLCVLKGVPTVFVDDRAQVDAQIEVLAAVLRRYDWSDEERATMNPHVLTVLTRAARQSASSAG
jgi:hypothetical protein